MLCLQPPSLSLEGDIIWPMDHVKLVGPMRAIVEARVQVPKPRWWQYIVPEQPRRECFKGAYWGAPAALFSFKYRVLNLSKEGSIAVLYISPPGSLMLGPRWNHTPSTRPARTDWELMHIR